uniref:Choline/carnitine acyltransferase domain-containing protein n=1 Tax=Phlebotomus papatasi TaxID=29031 RepID=A0A1B0DR63_PHLPP
MERRDMIFVCNDGDPSTFEQDDLAPALPLPSLVDTMERYYDSLKPFGTDQELRQSREIIEDFKSGIGMKLQDILQKKAQTEKNWIRVGGVNGTDPVTVNRVIDDVDIMVTRERRINEEDNMRPSIRSLDDIGVPVTRVVDLSDLAPTPPIYTTPPITDTPPATTTTPTTETTEPPVMTPYDRRDYLVYVEAVSCQ